MKSSYFWGIIIVLLGLALLLNNLGITDIKIGELISTYWPVIFIFFRPGSSFLIRGIGNWKVQSPGGSNFYNPGTFHYREKLRSVLFQFCPYYGISSGHLVLIFARINLLKSGSISKDSHLGIISGILRKTEHWKLSNENYIALLGGE